MKKSNLDERQEQVLLKIEHNGCWLAFWGLLIVFIVEQFMYGFEFKMIAGEWLVFMVLAVYISGECLRHGIWDRRLKANFKTNAIVSVIAGVISGIAMGIGTYFRFRESIIPALYSALFIFLMVTGSCIVLLSLTARKYKKKVAELEKELDEKEEEL